jgi:hypothetical protein
MLSRTFEYFAAIVFAKDFPIANVVLQDRLIALPKAIVFATMAFVLPMTIHL